MRTDCLVLSLSVLVCFLVVSSCTEEEALRVDCQPGESDSEAGCLARGCTWSPPTLDTAAPSCYFPPDYGYLGSCQAVYEVEGGWMVNLTKAGDNTLFGNDFQNITIFWEFQTRTRIRVKIFPSNTARYEVPIVIQRQEEVAEDDLDVKLECNDEPVFSWSLVRKSSGAVLFDSSLGGLTVSEQFLQISGLLPSQNIYGFGEQEQPKFRHDINWRSWGMFARDQAPEGDGNLYGVHPRYTVLEDDGQAHGVLFLNSNAQDVTLTPAPGLVYRTIGGLLDIYFFLGPSPEAVVSQYTEAVGRYYIPPYWSLGFHLCRWGYNSLENMEAAWQRTRDAGIPFDVQWGDIDYMDRRLDFTVDPTEFAGLSEFVDKLHSLDMKFVPILDPAISSGEPGGSYPAFDDGVELDVWVKDPSGAPVVGQVWPDDPTYFPDFSSPVTQQWWVQQILGLYEVMKFDGLWIDMNEPANFVTGSVAGCTNNSLNYPPYKPHTSGPDLLQKTICLDSLQSWGSHYDTHSMYGWSETEPTLRGVREATSRRGLVLSRSTFVGSGRWTAHWLGDNWSQWDNLHYSIIGILQFNQFGVPLVGADICGFIGNSTEELCARWQQLGAFYPFSRNHNVLDAIDQDPGVWEGGRVARAARLALKTKYFLLPYLYTLFYLHSSQGSTVVRPLWHEFPTDPEALDLDTQFMWGPALVVAPVLDPGTTTRSVYLPLGEEWYDHYTLTRVQAGLLTASSTWEDESASVPLYWRAGHVVPGQTAGLNTADSRRSGMTLMVFLTSSGTASGSLFLDDGESLDTVTQQKFSLIEFEVSPGSMISSPRASSYTDLQFEVDRVVVAGMMDTVTAVMVNNAFHHDFNYSADTNILDIQKLSLHPLQSFTINWS